MKKVLVILSIVTIVFASIIGIAIFANNQYPTQPLYSLDRTLETWQLKLYKSVGNAPYAKLNLQLARERLSEIQMYKQRKLNTSLVFKSYAQVTNANSVDDVIKGLIADFNNNLSEVKKAFNEMQQDPNNSQTIELAKEIGDSTTNFGSNLMDILPDLSTDQATEVEDSSTILDNLDDDAVGELVTESAKSDSNDSNGIKSLSIEKVSKKILKATEKLKDLEDEFKGRQEDKKLTQDQITLTQTLISTINIRIQEAKSALESGDLPTAYSKSKEALSLTEQAKNGIDDGNDSQDSNSSDNQNEDQNNNTTDDSKDTTNNNENDKSNDTKTTTKTVTKTGSKTDTKVEDNNNDSNSNDTQDNQNESDSNDNSGGNDGNDNEQDSVKGVTTNKSDNHWIDLTF